MRPADGERYRPGAGGSEPKRCPSGRAGASLKWTGGFGSGCRQTGVSSVETDILIVGAGLAGAATAYHLARCGGTRVLLAEQEAVPGAHSSGRNAAIVRTFGVDPALQSLLAQGAACLRAGTLAGFQRRGVMLLGMGSQDVRPHFPRASGTGTWCPDDGTVDVAGLLGAYLAGQEVLFNTKVLGWVADRGRLRVRTTRGEILCRLVVNAAGPWAGTLADLPLTPLNRHLFATPPLRWVDAAWACVWDVAGGLYFRPESGGLLLCSCDETIAEPGDYRQDPRVLEQLAEKVAALQPGLGELRIQSTWVGQRVFAPDRRFLIGYDPRDPRVFHVAGLGGHGVTASFAVGRLAAELIAGRSAEGSEAFDPRRLL